MQAMQGPPTTAPGAACAVAPPPLVAELERTRTSFLEPLAFFVSWQGVLTLAYRGFTQPLVDLKNRIGSAHPALSPENPGSKWPKTTLGCLRDGQRLTPEQLAALCVICKEESAAAFQQAAAAAAAAGAGDGSSATGCLKLALDSACITLFECRSLERLVSCQHVTFQGAVEEAGPPPEEQQRVLGILAEPDAPDYWFAASRDGNREAHYRGNHLGATLMHPLMLAVAAGHGSADEAGHAARPGLRARGVQELADRRALLDAIDRFRRRVDAELPGMYAWFNDASLHITLRALIN